MIKSIIGMVLMSTMVFSNPQVDTKEIKPLDEKLEVIITQKIEEEKAQKEAREELPHITAENFEEEVLKSDRIVLVDFYATWCKPCQKLAPVLSRLSNTEFDLKVVKVSGPDQNDLKNEYDVTAYPTMIFFKDGKEVKRLRGFKKYEVIKEEIEKMMAEI